MSTLRAAILRRFDSRTWGGVSVIDMDASPVALPAYSAAGEGHHFDVLDLLNGRGVAAADTLSAIAAARWTASGAGGTCTLYLDPTTGHFAISTSAADFTIPAHADNALLGFDVAGHALVGGGAPFVRLAPSPPTLDPLIDFTFTIDPTGAPAAFTVGDGRWYQDPYTALRPRGSADADDSNATGCLEALLQAEYSDTSIACGLNGARHAVIAWNSGGDVGTPTWSSTTFRDAIGFTGLEVAETSGDVSWITADRMCPTVTPLEEGLDVYTIGTKFVAGAGDLLTGAGTSNVRSRIRTARVEAYILGPSMGSASDASRHWLDRGMPATGEPVTIYPTWGDPRRWRDPWLVTADVLMNDLVGTALEDGYRGRFRGYVPKGGDKSRTVEWEGNIRQRFKVEMMINEAP